MHITLGDQSRPGHDVTLCIDRQSSTAQVIKWCCVEDVVRAAAVAKALTPEIIIVVPEALVQRLIEHGFVVDEVNYLMRKDLSGKKASSR